jgi:hypothetical protein
MHGNAQIPVRSKLARSTNWTLVKRFSLKTGNLLVAWNASHWRRSMYTGWVGVYIIRFFLPFLLLPPVLEPCIRCQIQANILLNKLRVALLIWISGPERRVKIMSLGASVPYVCASCLILLSHQFLRWGLFIRTQRSFHVMGALFPVDGAVLNFHEAYFSISNGGKNQRIYATRRKKRSHRDL